MEGKNTLDTILVTGFLGAGKTTLLNQLLENLRTRPDRVCLLINEFGKIGIDGSLVSAGPETIHEINAGSIFCVCTRDQFLTAFDNTATSPEPYDLLIIEATGIAATSDLGAYLYGPPLDGKIKIKKNYCLIDAMNFHKVKTTLPAVLNQVEEATDLIINKSDMVDINRIEELKKELTEINPRAEITAAEFGKIDFDKSLEGLSLLDDWNSLKSLAEFPPENISSASLSCSGILDGNEFKAFLAKLPSDTIRGKGTLNIDNEIMQYEWVIDSWSKQPFKKDIKENTLVLIGKDINETFLQAKFSSCLKN